MASYARAPEDDHDDGDYAPHSPYPQYDYPASSAGGGGGGMRDEAPQQRGHAPELSMSFYNEAAAALSGPASVHAPSVRGGGAAEPLQASLPALLSSPYGAQHAAQTSTPNPFAGGPVEDAYAAPPQQYAAPYGQEAYDYGTGFDDAGYGGNYANPNADMERDAGSPRSSYDDKTEVSHTPMPLGYGAGAAPTPSSYLRDDGQGFSRGGGGDEDEDDDDDNGQRYPGYAGYAKEYSNPPEQWGDEDGEREHDMNAAETMHFGPAPPRGAQLRRHKTRKNVKLTHGNLVLDCPVPTKLQGFLSRRGDEEFTSMRYTAVTSNPDDFFASHFNLRPAILNRHTEIHIAITLYNEDEILFTRTLHGVMKNIAHLCSRHKSRTWGPDGWKKVVVSIIADGRKKIHPRVLDCLAALGVYQEGVAKNSVNGKQVQAHVYEYTTQLSIDSNLQFKGAERGLVPMQIIFCMKEKNAKKINSHRWFFNAFGPVLQPNVCILIDAGTRPEAKSIYRLWKAFDLNSNVGGACGEIEVDNGGKWGVGPLLINPFVSAQNYEYKVSNQLEKTTESLLGNISVLPGAFSAYRYIALQNNESGLGPLASYFKGETIAGDAQTFSHANMYLAEDRILCFELAAKRGESWVLRYVPNARGVTDVPDTLHELISQRRRWLNGSFFAALYSLTHTGQYLSSGHGFWRRSALLFGSVYSLVNLSFAWFSLGNFYIFFRLLTSSLEAKEFKLKGIKYVNTGAQYLYLGTTIACFILALGNRPAGSKHKFLAAAGIYAVLTAYMMVAAVLCLVKVVKAPERDAIYSQMIFSVLATYGVYFMSALIALDPMHLLTSFAQYMLIAPSYINILNAYAFANLHDFSWGTKGITKDETDLGTVVSSGKGTVEVVLPTAQADIDLEYDQSLNNLRTRPMIIRGEASREEKEEIRNDWFRDIRTNVLLLWTLSNGILAALILGGDNAGTFDPGSGTTRSKIYMLIILIFLGAMAIIRFTLSSVFQIHRLLVG